MVTIRDIAQATGVSEIVPAFIGRIDLKLEGFVFYCKNGLHLLFSLLTVLYKSNIQKTEQLKMNKALHRIFKKSRKRPIIPQIQQNALLICIIFDNYFISFFITKVNG